ncbi:SLAM family member 9-like isoform X1 [Trematomus bernacchii]|uniref:SLAM family member 9-like isoform X1 n=1 Tax=Trematomus bernacchii TaxID=40690 RepID=UPI00146CB96E|nr:SLAM family member 9-like isoform X1 [Trematomus bernacchii]
MKSFVTVLFVVYELYLCESQGISARTPVFVLKGEDLLLNVTKDDVLQDVFSFSWKFKENLKVLTVNPGNTPNVFPDYTGRIEFLVNNFSVKLKNLQEADSGVYTAVVTKLSGEETEAAKYKIKVQDRASLPLLTVSSVSRSSPSCSFSVTCSSQDSHINSTFTCDTRTCSQEGGERSEGIPDTFLQVHLSSRSIICNHSNHVSWTSDTIIITNIQDVCPKYVPPKPDPVPIILGVFFTILILAIIGVVLWCLRMRRTSKRVIIENTIYDTAQFVAPARTQDPTDDEASAPYLSSTYAMVGPHTGPPAPTETRNTAPLESVYAQVKNTTPGP